jgi:hypothetical protein
MGLLLFVTAASAQDARIEEFPLRGFSFSDSVLLPFSPDTAFDVMTGDIRGWWDHHFSNSPIALTIEPRAGGSFLELFDNEGHGARHAVILYAERGKRLRMEGPLGLSGRALTFVATWDYAKRPGGTLVTLSCNMSGQIDPDLAKAVAGVWHHFFYDGLLPYVKSGKYLEKYRP